MALQRGELARLEEAEMDACRRALARAAARARDARAALQVATGSALPQKVHEVLHVDIA